MFIRLFSYIVICHLQHHNDTIIKTQQDFFRKISTPQFIVSVRKGCVGFYCEKELETEQNCNILTSHSYGRQRCVFLVLLMLNRRPWGPLCWLSLLHLISKFSGPQNPSGFPRAPSAWWGFPYHNSSITPSPTVTATDLTPVLTELYNSSTPTQSPTRSLK